MNYITAHFNPDTDAIACVLGMAALAGPGWTPVISGRPDDEALWVLDHLNIPVPPSTTDFSDAEKIILLDTHFLPQLPDDFPADKVIRIIDHHPGNDFSAFPNAREIYNKCGGAAASIFVRMMPSEKILDKKILRLLGLAIQSNSNNLRSWSTNDFDRGSYAAIGKIAPIHNDEIAGMFGARARILKEGAYKTLAADFKLFDTDDGKLGISQIEQWGLFGWLETVDIESALRSLAADKGLDLCAVNCADISVCQSIVFTVNDRTAELMRRATGLPFAGGTQQFGEMVLRKNLTGKL